MNKPAVLTLPVLVGLFCLSVTPMVGAVAIDSVSPSSAGTAVTGGSSLTWTHTVSATASNRAIVVGVAVGAKTDSGLSLAATYNSVALPSVAIVHVNSQNVGFIQWFCLAAPAAGTNTVSVSLAGGSADLIGRSISFTGVNQSAPCKSAVTAADTGTTVAAPTGTTVTNVASSSQTIAWLKGLNTNNTRSSDGAQSTAPGASTVSFGSTGGQDYRGIIGVDVAAATSSGALNACDIDGNGVLNSADVIGIVSMVVNITPCTANIIGAGVCNVVAVQRVINAVNGSPCVIGNSHTVVLNWTASTSSGVTGYNIYRSTSLTGTFTKLTPTPVSALTYTDSTIQAGQTYYYQATSVDVNGNESAPSTPATAVIPYP